MSINLRFGVLLLLLSLFAGGQSIKPLTSEEILDLVNADRITHGLSKLELDPTLNLAAQAKAQDMITKNYFGHVSPEGTKPWHWLKAMGYEYAYAGENLASGFDDASDLESSWMQSPSHRANILSPFYSEAGVAVVRLGDRNLVVEFFGSKDEKLSLKQ